MKKLFLMLLAVALVGSFAFAEVTGVDAPTLSGEVSVFFGYDLDTQASGFQNDSSVDVVVPLAGGSDSAMGEGDIYAEITIEDIEISLSTDDEDVSYDADVSAKIVMGDLYIGLGNPSLSFNAVELGVDIFGDYEADGVTEIDPDEVDDNYDVDFNGDAAGDNGISVGYVTDAFSIEFGIASKSDWEGSGADSEVAEDNFTSWIDTEETDEQDQADAVAANVRGDYAFGLNSSVAAGPLTLDVYAAYEMTYGSYETIWDGEDLMAFGAVPVVMTPVGALALPVDYVKVGDDWGFEMAPTFMTELPGIGSIEATFFMNMFEAPMLAFASTAGAGSELTGNYAEFVLGYEGMFMEDALSVAVDVTVENIIAAYTDDVAGALLSNLSLVDGEDLFYEVALEASYDLGGIIPYVATGYDTDGAIPLNIGVDIETVVDNAVVNVDYDCGDLADWSNGMGVIKAGVTVSY